MIGREKEIVRQEIEMVSREKQARQALEEAGWDLIHHDSDMPT